MRRKTVKTALGMLILSVLVVFGLTASAYAIVGETPGAALLYTYYDIRNSANLDIAGDAGLNLTDNYFTVTNTATQWSQAHVRVRTGHHSVELLDFDILLSPKDVFTFDLYADGGATVFASCDTKTLINSGFTPNFDRNGDGVMDCFVLDSSTFPNMTSLILACDPDATTEAQAVDHTRKGYVEIIGEGVIDACASDKKQCKSSPCCGVTGCVATPFLLQVSDPGQAKLLENLGVPGLSIADNCGATAGVPQSSPDVHPMGRILIGAEYFATVTNGTIVRLAKLNGDNVSVATASNNTIPGNTIFHAESYAAELASSNCTLGDAARGCYAYIEATNLDPVVDGADDMNFCFFQDTIIPANTTTSVGVRNKYGAAATFGPTLADIAVLRDGTIVTTRNGLSTMSFGFAHIWSSFNGLGGQTPLLLKNKAETHYFATPAPGVFDVDTNFAFIFPLQHFIGESEAITGLAIFDNEENTTTISTSKFISPGLPTQATPAVEVNLFSLINPPFVEGWIQFGLTATNKTRTTCTDPNATTTTTNCLVANGSTTYVPGFSGAVFNVGANELAVSPWHYDQ